MNNLTYNVFAIGASESEALAEIAQAGGYFNKETGEIYEEKHKEVISFFNDSQQMAIYFSSVIQNEEYQKKCIEEAIENMKKRRDALSNRIENRKKRLQQDMEQYGITEVKCPYFDIKICKAPPSTKILDINDVPEEYWNTKIEKVIDKAKVLSDLKAGKQVKGAEIKQSSYLRIK